MNEPRIEVHDDAAELATAVAGELLTRLADAQSAGAVPQICLTGGTIAGKIHQEIARLSPNYPVDWTRVEIWWGDERYVAPDSEDRNALEARRDFLDVVGADPALVHEMASTENAPDVDVAAAAYAETMRAHTTGEFDVLMLGMGPDGHVASLFPGFAQLDVDDEIVVGVSGSTKPPPLRISLTFPALNRARSVWFLVSGEEKAQGVASAQTPGQDVHETPAAGVTGVEETIWFLDRDAASLL